MNYCLGTVQFGMNYGVQNNGRPNLELVFNILDEAISNGVFCFDTAMAYGNAEQILGKYICERNINKDYLKIITKGKSQSDLQIIINNINNSIENMHIEQVYGFLFHDSTVVYSKGKMNLLSEIKSNGYSENIGVSIYTPEEALKALEYDIDIIQVPYNLFDSRLDKVDFFKKAKEKSIEIYARSSLLQGLALMDYNKLPSNVLFAKDYLIEFDNLCKKYGIDRLNAAVNYVASNDLIDYIVFGTDNLKQFKEYMVIKDKKLPIEFINEIKNCFSDVSEKLVNPVLWK